MSISMCMRIACIINAATSASIQPDSERATVDIKSSEFTP